MEPIGAAETSANVFKTLRFLTPFDIDIELTRIGPSRDGGYVFANQFAKQDLISFGVADDVRCEKIFAENGHRCFLHDHTIESLTDAHGNIFFRQLGISGATDETDKLFSIRSHLAQLDVSENLLLKIDVEGAEWDVFSTIDDDDLLRFDQIVGEFHGFSQIHHEAFRQKVFIGLQKLTRHFTLFNVHANNYGPLGFVGGFPVADVIELSFIRNDLVKSSPNTRIFPRDGDKANSYKTVDHALLFFPFLPTSSSVAEMNTLVTRMILDRGVE